MKRCLDCENELALTEFYPRSGYEADDDPGHYLSYCIQCQTARGSASRSKGRVKVVKPSPIRGEQLVHDELMRQGIWCQYGRNLRDGDTKNVDLVCWGVVYIEVKYDTAEWNYRHDSAAFRFSFSKPQQNRGVLADIIALVCEYEPDKVSYHFFRANDEVFYNEERLKSSVGTIHNFGAMPRKHKGIPWYMMERARDNLDLIETVRLEHSESIRTSPFPHRRWREIESA